MIAAGRGIHAVSVHYRKHRGNFMAVKFGIRGYSRNGNDVTFTVVALNADGTVDTNFTGAFTWGLNGMSDPGAAAFAAGDLGQRTYTTTILNPAVRTGLVANFPGTATGANLSVSGPSSNNVSFGSQGDHLLVGGTGNDTITGNIGNDLFLFQQGGNDSANGGAGNDTVNFGATYTEADSVNGGAGDADRVILQGDYSAGVTLGTLVGVERLEILAGADTRFGDTANNFYDYNLTASNATLAAGQVLTVDASSLRAGEDFTFNGSAETDANFVIYGGRGTDNFTGGADDDIFFFADNGRFAAGDTVNGSGGFDGLFLRGNYSIDFTQAGYTGALAGIENLTVLGASDERYFVGGGTEFDYTIIWDGALLAAGQTLTVDATTLGTEESLAFSGSDESDGRFELLGGNGNDVLTGGAGNDIISGGGRGDTLTGGAGNDLFVYRALTDSNSTERDGIQDFNLGDRIDLSLIDANTNAAGHQGFTFIGSSAFSNTAGQLRFENISLGGPIWLIQADANGDGISDLEIVLVISPADPITASDFILAPPNLPPLADLNGVAAGIDTTATYIEGSPKVALAPAIVLSDDNSGILTGATVTIASGFASGDALRVKTGATGISFDYNDTTGVLTLSGSASVADYQSVLATLSFKTASDNPGTARDIVISVTDGSLASAEAHITLTVSPVNDAPVNSVPGNQTGEAGIPIIFSAANGNALTVSDPDGSGEIVRVRVSVDHGTLTLASTSGLTVTGDGTDRVILTGTLASVNAALEGLQYEPIGFGSDTLTISSTDRPAPGSGDKLTDTDTVGILIEPNLAGPEASGQALLSSADQQAGAAYQDIAGAFAPESVVGGAYGQDAIGPRAGHLAPDLSMTCLF